METTPNSNLMIENIIKEVRNSPVFQELVPMEAVSGWTIPFKRDERVYLRIPFYRTKNEGKGNTLLYPPMAIITVDCSSKIVVEYLNTKFKSPWSEGDWETEVGSFPHEAIARMTVGEYKECKQKLMQLYNEIVKCLMDGSKLNKDTHNEFMKLLNLLVEPGLKPFYKAIGPKFFGHFLHS